MTGAERWFEIAQGEKNHRLVRVERTRLRFACGLYRNEYYCQELNLPPKVQRICLRCLPKKS